MPPQRRTREYETAVEADAIHASPEKLSGFGEKREVIKSAELEELRQRAQQAEMLREQLSQALTQQGQGSSALAVQADGSLRVHDFQFTPTGLVAPDQVSQDAWEQIGLLLFRLEGWIQWLIGDWIVYGQDLQWGDVTQIAAHLGRLPSTLHDYAYVSRHVQFSFRKENLTYTHHAVVAPLTPDQQEYALSEASANKMSVSALRQLVKQIKGEIDTPALPTGGSITAMSRELEKFMQRDPAKAKPQEREQVRLVTNDMQRELDELRRKWGIDE